MTLARPPYSVTAQNLTAGWTYTATHGDKTTLDDDVQLADGLTFTWSFTNGLPPHLDPDQISFKIYATSAAVLPSMDVGDLMRVTVVRPTAGLPIEYFTFEGRLAEPELEPIRKRGIIATLMATGLLADFAGITVSDAPWPQEVEESRYDRIARVARINIAQAGLIGLSSGAIEVDARPALDLLREVVDAQGAPGSTVTRVLRAAIGPDVYTYAYGSDDIYIQVQGYIPADYTIHKLAPFKLVKVGLVAQLQLQPLDVTDTRVISAAVIELSNRWRKDKADAINTVSLTGITSVPDANPTVVASYPDLVAKYGENGRTIATQMLDPQLWENNQAAPHLPQYDDALPSWSVEGLTIVTSLMTDAELDRYAPTFFPPAGPGAPIDAFPRRVIIPDVDAQLAVNGAAITGTVTGCTFAINDGQLTITPTVRNEAPSAIAFDDGIKWSTLAANAALEGTTAGNPAVLHIDPDMTWRDIALATI